MIMPAYNEEANIEVVVREWHKEVVRIGESSKLVVIDDGSKDSTYQKLLELQRELPQLIPLTKTNEGHGPTLLYGYRYALQEGADYIFQTDSDGQTLASEFADFWEKRKEYDILIGTRTHREDGWSRIIVTKVLKKMIQVIFRIHVEDANTPYRLMKADIVYKYIKYVPEHFALANVILSVYFVAGKENILFLPITFLARQGGINSINIRKIIAIGLQSWRDFHGIKKQMKVQGEFINDKNLHKLTNKQETDMK